VFAGGVDGCAYVSLEGRRCGSRTALQVDHIRPFAAGGGNDVSNLRLLCAAHNRLAAVQTLGAHVMGRFWRRE
jgi:5-methylcytosine-specific restriction endonuclease McrA